MTKPLVYPIPEVEGIDPDRFRTSLLVSSDCGPPTPAQVKAIDKAAKKVVASLDATPKCPTSATFGYSYETPLPPGLDPKRFQATTLITLTDEADEAGKWQGLTKADTAAIEAALTKKR